jgi:L-alanine-DL-glutamate epimerase-like enolase superfamily enzyme
VVRVAGASILEFRRTLDGRSWNPAMRWTERRAPLLLLHGEDGSVGIGEAWSRQAEIAHVLDGLAEAGRALVGRDVDDETIAVATPDHVPPWVAPAIASAIDMALWDLRAKHAGEPLWRMLAGNAARDGRVAVYASGGLYRDDAIASELAHEMQGYVATGFTAVKMKIGVPPFPEDLVRVRTVREAIGDDVTLWVDAVNQLPPEHAVDACRALADCGAHAIQAPVAFDDLETMARINRHALPVIVAEGEHAHERFLAMLDAQAVGCLQFCLGLVGGFTGGTKLAAMGAAHGVPSTPQCFSTAVMQAASLHFGAAHRTVATVEYHRFHDHLAALLPGSMREVVDGHVALGAEPGLGIATLDVGPQACGGEILSHATFGLH